MSWLVASVSVTVYTRFWPSTTASSPGPGLPGSTVSTPGLSLSMIWPVPVTLPMVSGTVSFGPGSYTASSTVGMLTSNWLTPAGTVIVPSAFSTTPLVKLTPAAS